MADALPESTLAALEDPFAQLTGPLASTTRLDLKVVDSARLTPHMQRLRLTAPQLDGFGYQPGQDVMLLVAADGNRPVRRRYTIRALDQARQLLTIDVVLHGDGPGERWVRAARPGDRIEGIAPRGKITASPSADWHLFIGDESALPAIFAMTESLPGDSVATLIIEIPGPDDEQELSAAPGPGSAGCTASARPRASRRAGRRGGRGRAAARRRSCVPARRGKGGVPAAGRARRPRAPARPGVAQGLLGPGPRQRRTRRAREGRLADGGDGRGDLGVHLYRDREPGRWPAASAGSVSAEALCAQFHKPFPRKRAGIARWSRRWSALEDVA